MGQVRTSNRHLFREGGLTMAKNCGNCIYHEKILNIETLLLCGLDGETVTPNTDGCYDWKKDDREDERE